MVSGLRIPRLDRHPSTVPVANQRPRYHHSPSQRRTEADGPVEILYDAGKVKSSTLVRAAGKEGREKGQPWESTAKDIADALKDGG